MRRPGFHDVRRFIDRLVGDRFRPRAPLPAQPTFADEALFTHLSGPATAVAAWRQDDRDGAWRALIEHFRRRDPAFGFLSPADVSTRLADAERRFPTWRPRLLAKVREDRVLGLPVYDRRAGSLSASFDWNVAAGGPLEDRLYGVRPHRFGFVPRWALACHFDRSLIADLDRVLAGWMASAGPRGHAAFHSSHVVLYNLTALLLAWPFLAALDGSDSEAALESLRRRVLLILFEDSRFLRESSGSAVANNHLLAERFADWLTAALLPELTHALDRVAAERVWIEELHRQTFDDGGSFEHSVHYQEHECEMAAAYLLLSQRNGWTIPAPARHRIECMLQFQLALAGPALLPLALGNTTEDPLLPLGVGEGWQSGFLREVRRRCFGGTAPIAAFDDPTLETAFWLLDAVPSDGDGAPYPEPVFQDFPNSGMCVFAEPEHAARLILRSGPSPDAPGIGGHSHCDLLSLHLSVGTQTVFPAPGTATYRFKPHPALQGRPNLRAHFASASCRSGVFLDGAEPYGSLQGDFRDWRLPCQVEARRASNAAAALSWVEGDVVGAGPYVGQRRGVVHVWEHGWLVYDRLPERSATQPAYIGWQLAPDLTCHVAATDRVGISDAVGTSLLRMVTTGAAEPTLACGSFEPFRGWISPSYGQLQPAPNLRFRLPATTAMAAAWLSLPATTDRQLREVAATDDGFVFSLTGAPAEMLLMVATGARPKSLQWNDNTLHGRMLCAWRGAEGIRIRALGLLKLALPAWKLELSFPQATDFEIELAAGVVRWPRRQRPDATLQIHRDGR